MLGLYLQNKLRKTKLHVRWIKHHYIIFQKTKTKDSDGKNQFQMPGLILQITQSFLNYFGPQILIPYKVMENAPQKSNICLARYAKHPLLFKGI